MRREAVTLGWVIYYLSGGIATFWAYRGCRGEGETSGGLSSHSPSFFFFALLPPSGTSQSHSVCVECQVVCSMASEAPVCRSTVVKYK